MLYLDCGNTALKCRYHSIDSVFKLNDEQFESNFLAYLKHIEPTQQVVISSVANPDSFHTIETIVSKHFQLAPIIAKTESSFAGLRNAYKDFNQLGIDRWLGIIATKNTQGLRIIIDAGTWIKMDAVDNDQHLGGLIISPSKDIETDIFKRFNITDCSINDTLFGKSTQECICIPRGVYHTQAIDYFLPQWLKILNKPCKIILTGGEANLIQNRLKDLQSNDQSQLLDIQHIKNLVLSGLTIRYPN